MTTPDVRVIQVIETKLTRRGRGTEGDPHRVVTQWWTLDGQMLAEDDPVGHGGCIVAGHRVRNGAVECEHCGAGLDQIAKAKRL